MSSNAKLNISSPKRSGAVSFGRSESRVPGRLWQAGIYDPLNHIIQSSGKRLRAELVELAYHMAGGKGQVPIDLIEFIEILHAGSLVIDDIEDGSQTRRGKPTLHQVVGTPLAINTANWMYFSALERLQDLPLDPALGTQIMSQALTTIRRCHEGQALDLSARVTELQRRHVFPTTQEISRLKTGGLTALAASLGAAVGGAGTQLQQAFHSFGKELGIGLQMQNDLAELKSSTHRDGRCDDLRNARVTWPWAWASRIVTDEEFLELQRRLDETDAGDVSQVANALLDSIGILGEEAIRKTIKRSVSCLYGEFQSRSSAGLEKLLTRIEEYYV